MSARYVIERGSGSAGTAYNLKDYEVIDLDRIAARRVICRTTRGDAVLIAAALNAAVAQAQPAQQQAAE